MSGPGAATSWTPARIFLAVSAGFHIPVAIVGLSYDRAFTIGAEAVASAPSQRLFGVLETNAWHSAAALLVGVVSLYYAVRPQRARETALALGAAHVGIFVSLLVWDPSTFWLASNAADQVVHATTAVGGIVAGALTTRRVNAGAWPRVR